MFQLAADDDVIGSSNASSVGTDTVIFLDADKILDENKIDEEKIAKRSLTLTNEIVSKYLGEPFKELSEGNPCGPNEDCAEDVYALV